MHRLLAVLVVSSMCLAAPGLAQGLRPRDTGDVRAKGAWSVGVFNPANYALFDGFELEAHPLVLFAAPHLLTRVRHLDLGAGSWRVAGEYGLSLPSTAFHSGLPFGLRGDVFPSCKVAAVEKDKAQWCQTPGWFLVPRAGLVASWGLPHVLTLRADFAYGVHLTGEPGQPLDAWAPLDLLFAPALNGHRARGGVRYDRLVADRLRVAGELDLFHVGTPAAADRSPWTVRAWLGLDYAVGQASRLTLGAMYWNADQHATEFETDAEGFARRVRVRSNDFAPTLDFIWAN